MRHLLLAIPLLALACDDESLPGKVAAAQLHGMTAAFVDCAVNANTGGPTTVHYSAAQFLDGSCLATFKGFAGTAQALGTQFTPRDVPDSLACPVSVQAGYEVSAEDGALTINATDYAIDTHCTGFNLEAFGVAP